VIYRPQYPRHHHKDQPLRVRAAPRFPTDLPVSLRRKTGQLTKNTAGGADEQGRAAPIIMSTDNRFPYLLSG
jgi:hypothetical protein